MGQSDAEPKQCFENGHGRLSSLPAHLSVFGADVAHELVAKFVGHVVLQSSHSSGMAQDEAIRVGSAALNAFLQANVTGPVLEGTAECEAVFISAYEKLPEDVRPPVIRGQATIEALRRLCIRSLDIDGVSVYPYIPQIELFCLARWIFTSSRALPVDLGNESEQVKRDLAWMRFRIHMWHYKLLSQPSLSPGSLFTKGGRWTDVATLQEMVERNLEIAEAAVLHSSNEAKESKIHFLLEKANAHIMLGDDTKAKHALRQATEISNFVYALSGALGKRTRFQEKSTSQLVVLAKSREDEVIGPKSDKESGQPAPDALPLNDDTLLEKISFGANGGNDQPQSNLPAELQDLAPDNQPQLKPEDQIILLTEATWKDTFSAADSLTAEEILPFAVRVIEEQSSNWQIYTQALLVRSRIELNRSRTVERGVLQMQALVDQIIVDTIAPARATTTDDGTGANGVSDELAVPTIQVSTADELQSLNENKLTSFLPAPKATESASPHVRLRYVNALSPPPRWHLESELAQAWVSVGSLVSALEIFKRLRLWPEVALCLASNAAAGDEGGRGNGGEEKARTIVRWQLFHGTGQEQDSTSGDDRDGVIDTDSLNAKDFYGPERNPPPPNAPRLFCILGDLENEPRHYERAWEVSNKRYARAQRSLGELRLQKQDWKAAREAYRLAVRVNRLNPELWSRLGDIELRLGHFADAAEAFQRAISSSNGEQGGEDARTWSNLGTALLSWYREVVSETKTQKEKLKKAEEERQDGVTDVDANMPATKRAAELGKPTHKLLQDSLNAFRRGATIADSNWRIWDNVITLAASLSPKPALEDVILGTHNVLRIRNSEDALDVKMLGLLLRELTKEAAPGSDDGAAYEPPKGSLQRKISGLFEDVIVPLITTNSEVWALVSRLRAWRRDWNGALDTAERGWRAATGGSSGSTLSAAAATPSSQGNWLTNQVGWDMVVARTSELVAAYENWGPRIEGIGSKWKGKARSAVRSVMGRAKENWEGSQGWTALEGLMEDLRA